MDSSVHRTTRWQSYCLSFFTFLAFASLLSFLLPVTGDKMSAEDSSATSYLRYSTVLGYFFTDEPNTNSPTVIPGDAHFGLIDRPYDTDGTLNPGSNSTRWERFAHKIATMNKLAPDDTSYKVLFLARHGEGWHNVGEKFFGTRAWDCYYSMLNESNGMTFLDARLTDHGIQQARDVAAYWRKLMTEEHIPTPQRFIVSPLDRAINTAHLTFADLTLAADRPFRPLVKEKLRETIGIHTCDRRSSRSQISARWSNSIPPVDIESSFSEKDTLWLPDLRESASAHFLRLRALLDDIFSDPTIAASKDIQYVSLTSHGGTLARVLSVLGHTEVSIPTGGVLPVLIKIETVQGRRTNDIIARPWEPKPNCTHDEIEEMRDGE